MTQYVGLNVSLKETKLHVLDEAGSSRLKRLLTSDARLDNEANFVRNGPALVGVGTRWLFAIRPRAAAHLVRLLRHFPFALLSDRAWPASSSKTPG